MTWSVGADDSLELAGPPVGPSSGPQNANGEVVLSVRTYDSARSHVIALRDAFEATERSCLWGNPLGRRRGESDAACGP
jgi:hypothetical protein